MVTKKKICQRIKEGSCLCHHPWLLSNLFTTHFWIWRPTRTVLPGSLCSFCNVKRPLVWLPSQLLKLQTSGNDVDMHCILATYTDFEEKRLGNLFSWMNLLWKFSMEQAKGNNRWVTLWNTQRVYSTTPGRLDLWKLVSSPMMADLIFHHEHNNNSA